MLDTPLAVSIVIPVLNKRRFTAQCLDRIWRNTDPEIAYEVVVVDNASTDGTAEYFAERQFPRALHYLRNHTNLGFAGANNAGVRVSSGRYLLFLNNDTLVQPAWLREMLAIPRADPSVGIVGIKQLFPYTNQVYHTGIVFTADRQPVHLYPHLDGSLPQVNKQREYQAVNGACLLIDRALFDECGGFDEAYRNGYEDIDLCLKVRQKGRKIVCCTRGFIYHYGQISEGRTADDDANAALLARRWAGSIVPDEASYFAADIGANRRQGAAAATARRLPADAIYLADDLSQGSALTWINTELALTLQDRGVPVFVNGARPLSKTVARELGTRLAPLMLDAPPVGGTQIKWSHYWPQHLNLGLAGDIDFEFFVVNYAFGRPNAEPWDYWLQCVRQNDADKLALSEFCRSVLLQAGLPPERCHVWHPGYSREIGSVERPDRHGPTFRFLTVTNSHDLDRYNTLAVVDAYRRAFTAADDVLLVVKDYGASSGNPVLRQALQEHRHGPAIEYVSAFTSKHDLVRLYKSCDAFISAHRGEGFGMKILDAVACGLPVITPLFGGPTAYCTPDTCFPIPYSLIPMGDCLDTRSLQITNEPVWAEVDAASLEAQLRRVFTDPASAATVGRAGRDAVLDTFSWRAAADRLLQITGEVRERSHLSRSAVATPAVIAPTEHSPYWLGVRMTVVIPTHNRKEKLRATLDALTRQSVLPQEFEVIVVDDGSTDGTEEALESASFPFAFRYVRQAAGGAGSARNLAIRLAAGEHVLFIGDDILADERLLEEHLLAHAAAPEPGLAILGDIDWPPTLQSSEVMEFVCGESSLQFAYPLIRRLPELDHRFFYTSNISLRRDFLVAAADAGIRFDAAFRQYGFEDSEFAFRLQPRGLRIRYAERARAWHDHWMDLDSFARREFATGRMAVVFYRKHPAHEQHLQVRWIADLVRDAAAIPAQPELLARLRKLDAETDGVLRSLAGAYEELLAVARDTQAGPVRGLSVDRLRAGLHRLFGVIFDVHRTRGKVLEWYSNVEDPRALEAAQVLAAVLRKIDFLDVSRAAGSATAGLAAADAGLVAGLRARLTASASRSATDTGLRAAAVGAAGRLIMRPALLARLIRADRFMQARLQSPAHTRWLHVYLGVRRRIRERLI